MEIDINFERECSYCRNGRVRKGCSCGGCSPDRLPICEHCNGTGYVLTDFGEDLLSVIEKYFDIKRKEKPSDPD